MQKDQFVLAGFDQATSTRILAPFSHLPLQEPKQSLCLGLLGTFKEFWTLQKTKNSYFVFQILKTWSVKKPSTWKGYPPPPTSCFFQIQSESLSHQLHPKQFFLFPVKSPFFTVSSCTECKTILCPYVWPYLYHTYLYYTYVYFTDANLCRYVRQARICSSDNLLFTDWQ